MANALSSLDIPPNGPEQMPVIYVHGFIDDGTGWARDTLYLIEELTEPVSVKYARYYHIGVDRSPAAFFERNGMPNWAVQWWSTDNGNPYSTADEGYAFLMDAEELRKGTNWVLGTWTAQNRPLPSAIDVLTAPDVDVAVDTLGIPDPSGLTTAALKVAVASQLLIKNNYNDAGPVDPRAQDLLDLLRYERGPGGRLSQYRQVNLITHSMGSLVTRAMLDKAQAASRRDSEFVANVIYNAPPFGGSTMAHIDKLFHEGPITRETFADPMLQKMFTTSGTTAKDLLVNFMDVLLRPTGMSYNTFESSMRVVPSSINTTVPESTRYGEPLWLAVDLLENFPISDTVDWNTISNNHVGDALGLALTVVRPLADALLGFPGAPGYDDLTPAGGVSHLTSYSTNPDVQQFVTIGKQGFGIHLFPNDLQAVADNPNLITDVNANQAQTDDTAVAVGSAKLLTQVDAFGPPMTLLGEFNDLEHPDMLYRRLPVMGPIWLATFLAPPTTLHLNGQIEPLDSANRYYRVSQDTTFSFSSPVLERDLDFSIFEGIGDIGTVHITVQAQRYEYRVWRADGSGTPPTDWQSLNPGQSLSFGQLRDAHSLPDVPLLLEWRSINQNGGREMIRSAYLFIEPQAPQVTSQTILTPNQDEVYRRPSGALLGDRAVRGSFFQSIPEIQPLLDQITNAPESPWVVRDQSTKALSLAFTHRGHVEYVWNNPDFTGTTTLNDVTGLVLPLSGLPDGLNTLYFETFNAFGERSPRQQISILIDNNPPLTSLFYRSDHSLGYVVGPNTPLRFEVQDLETDGGSGSLTVPGYPGGSVPANTTFTLGETDLDEQGRENGLVGADVSLTASAVDLVGNEQSETIQVYFDWTPPALTLQSVENAISLGGDAYQAYTDTVTVQVQVVDGEPPIAQVLTENGGAWTSPPFTLQGTNTFEGQVRLNPGENLVTIGSRDAVGNVGTLTLNVEWVVMAPDGEPLDLLSVRLPKDQCYDENGDPLPDGCSGTQTVGAIAGVVSDFYGETFLFASAGALFAAGDNNGRSDIFAWRDGQIVRVSETADGSQATGGDSTHPAISGNGRYAFFRSRASNLVPGAEQTNLYVKDLVTGEIAVVSRNSDGQPANLFNDVVSFQKTAVTYSGRYVFFESRGTNHVSGYTDTNTARDVFMADLDPDGDGYFFDDNYVIYPISTAGTNAMGNGESRAPDVSIDGRYLVFESRATNIGDSSVQSALASNGDVTDILLAEFSGSESDGSLDVSTPVLKPINTSHYLGQGGTLTATEARYPRVHPLGDVMILFTTRSNIDGTGDTNNQSLGQDIYVSHRTGDPNTRLIEWISYGVGGTQSSENINAPIQFLSLGMEPSITSFTGGKKTWVSPHNNIVSGDTNNVADLFIQGTTTASNLPIINWIEDDPLLPSTAVVNEGGVTPDGRYAFWVTTQDYAAPYGTGAQNLYLRRIEPPFTSTLTINIVGQGSVERTPEGTPNGSAFDYQDTDKVMLAAIPATGWRFAGWQGEDSSSGTTAQVAMHHTRVVTATFEPLQPPTDVAASMVIDEDTSSSGIRPTVTDPDSDDYHTFTVLTQPGYGTAEVRNNLLYYTPDPDFSGSDSFTIRATDSAGLSVDGAVTVTVSAVPDPPVVSPLAITTTQGVPSEATAPTIVDPDPGDTFSLAISIPPAHGTVSIVESSGTPQFIYTPDAGFSGTDTFTFLVVDSAGLSTLGDATVTVTAAPTPSPSLTVNFTTGAPGSFFIFTAEGFSPNATAAIYVNNIQVAQAQTDDNGRLIFTLSTTGLPPGTYTVRVEVNPQAEVSIVLDSNAPLREDTTDPIFSIPLSAGLPERVYLPLVIR